MFETTRVRLAGSLFCLGLLVAVLPQFAAAQAELPGAKRWALSTETSGSFNDLFLQISRGEVVCKSDASTRVYTNSPGLFARRYSLRTVLVVLKDGSPAIVYVGAREAGDFEAYLTSDEVDLLYSRVGLGLLPVCVGRTYSDRTIYDVNLK